MIAVRFTIERETQLYGTVIETVTQTGIETKQVKVTYRQKWHERIQPSADERES